MWKWLLYFSSRQSIICGSGIPDKSYFSSNSIPTSIELVLTSLNMGGNGYSAFL